jgi:predicted alternative tryptophan synthase beta-subunit
VKVVDRKVNEKGSRYIDFVIPGLLGMNLMGSGIWAIGFAIVDSRSKRLLKRFMATPMSRAEYLMALDKDALDCVQECSTYEGVLPALESAHALWGARELAKRQPRKRILIGLSGRGDKDMPTLQGTLLADKGAA